MKGCIIERKGKRGTSYRLKWDEGRDEKGRRITRNRTFRGTREGAELAMQAIIEEVCAKNWSVSRRLSNADLFRIAMNKIPDLLFLINRRFSPDEIREFSKVTGVYILFVNSEVVYVGRSSNIKDRLRTHKQRRTCDFSEVSIVPCRDEQASRFVESALILNFSPRLNSRIDVPALHADIEDLI